MGRNPLGRASTGDGVLRRLVPTLAGACLFAALLLPSPAEAGVDVDYGGICSLTVTPQQVTAGGQALVEGESFEANFATAIILDDGTANEVTLFTPVVTDANGEFSQQVTFPANLTAGAHTVSAECDTDVFADADITVLAGGQLPPVLVVDPNSINCTGGLTGFADHVQPNSSVTFRVQDPNVVLATVNANAAGRADFSVANFATGRSAGTFSIVSTGLDAQGAAFSLSDPVTLTFNGCSAVTPTTAAQLPRATARTGTDVAPEIAAGVGILAVGGIFVAASRRRRNQAVAR
jgi:hypothetical protein